MAINEARRLPGIGTIVAISTLGMLAVLGCDSSGRTGAGNARTEPIGKGELDLSQMIVENKWDNSVTVLAGPGRGGSRTVQTFYDRAGRQIEGLNLGYVLGDFHEGLATAWYEDRDGNALAGFVNAAGRVVIPFQYYYVMGFSNGRAIAAIKDSGDRAKARQGLIDRQGRWVVPAGKYAAIMPGSEGRWPFRIRTNEKVGELWGFLDADGKVVVEPKYRMVGEYSEGLCLALDGNDAMFMDKQGQVAFALSKDTRHAEGFSCGLALVLGGGERSRGNLGLLISGLFSFDDANEPAPWAVFLDHEGKTVIKAAYTAAGSFTESLAPVSLIKGASFTSYENEMHGSALDGSADVDSIQRWGFIDLTGKLVIPMAFDQVSQFSEGRARVRQGNKWGFIDKTGKLVIPPIYEWAESFHNGVAIVVKDRIILLIDWQGKIIVNTGRMHWVF